MLNLLSILLGSGRIKEENLSYMPSSIVNISNDEFFAHIITTFYPFNLFAIDHSLNNKKVVLNFYGYKTGIFIGTKREILLKMKYKVSYYKNYIQGKCSYESANYMPIYLREYYLPGIKYSIFHGISFESHIPPFKTRMPPFYANENTSPWSILLKYNPMREPKPTTKEIISVLDYLISLRNDFSLYSNMLLLNFVKKGNLEIVKYLIFRGIPPRKNNSKFYWYVLIPVGDPIRDEKIEEYFSKHGFKLRKEYFRGGEEFWYLKGDDFYNAKLLIYLGIDLIYSSISSALDVAYIYNQREILNYLKEVESEK